MTDVFSRDDLKTRAGRRRAWSSLMFADHGFVRLFYDNTHEVAHGQMWRSFQPSPYRLKRWKNQGIRTVINLRGDQPNGYYRLEEETCERLDLTLVTFRVFSREAPSKEVLHGAQKLFNEIQYPAVMHCKSGADRAGLMATLFRFFHKGVPLNEALEQLSFKYGHVKHGKTGVIDYAFQQYLDHAERKGIDLSSVDAFFDWVETDYDPQAIKKTFIASWWGTLLTEKILRRE